MSRPTAAHLDAYRRILDAHGVAIDYPPAVLAEVAALRSDPGIDDPRLTDLTGLPFVTIDYEESRDLDQAVHIERDRGGRGFVVRYALADAAWYVRPGSALFAEALSRGTSYYLPGFSVPMLPPALSEGIVSLNPRVDRRAVVFVMRVDDAGNAIATEVVRARVHSRAKLTYDGVQRHHDAPGTSPLRGQDYSETLDLLRTVGELRMAEARARDVVQYDREEIAVDPADEPETQWRVRRAPRNDASRWNEHVSLLCNIEGGRLLVGEGRDPQVQPVFRVHEPPSPESLAHLETVIAALLVDHGLDPGRIGWHRLANDPDGAGGARDAGAPEPLAEYLDRLRGVGIPERLLPERLLEAIERQALVLNRSACYAARPGAHYALGVRPYARFSAPMREVVGIFTHKEALERFALTDTYGDPAADEALRDEVIAAANLARDRQRGIEKAVLRLAIDDLLGRDAEAPKKDRREHRGTVLGLTPSRLYVRLDDPPIELKVYADDIARALGGPPALSLDGVALQPAAAPVVGPAGGAWPRFSLGDAVTLRTRAFDARGDRWRFDLAQANA